MKAKKSKTQQKRLYFVSLLNYFQAKADKYDLVDKQSYWMLSDDLLWFILQRDLNRLSPNFSFLDAGAGTGRWAIKILQKYPQSRGILIDISPDMLSVTAKKLKKLHLEDRVSLIEADLMDKKAYKKIKVDVAYNFHNVIGFVENPGIFIKNLARVVKTNGLVITMAPNLYHAIFFNILTDQVSRAKETLNSLKGKFTSEMPDINFFSPNMLFSLYKKAQLKPILMTGFPSVIYPGFQETQIEGQSASLKKLLENQKIFKSLFEIEKKLIFSEDIAARGNNLYIVGRKVSYGK